MDRDACICFAPEDGAGPGRPRGFDRDAAVGAMLEVFRARGYEGASLAELIAAANLSKSSFYCCFGNKRGALIAAVEAYSGASLAAAKALAAGAPDGRAGALAVIRRMALAPVEKGGCFAINAATELAAEDPEVAAALAAHFAALERVVARALRPEDPAAAAPRASALVALGIGALTLRKAGAGDAAAEAALAAAQTLIDA